MSAGHAPTPAGGVEDALLHVRNLTVRFGRDPTDRVAALQGVALDLKRGTTVAVVGESGSGKSTLALAVMGLFNEASVSVSADALQFNGRELLGLSSAEWRGLRGRRMAMIFQEPGTALNPVLTIGDQIAEVLRFHGRMRRRPAWNRAAELLAAVGITAPRRRLEQYPHQISGGMRQRVMIAMALAGEPDLLIADEPTTALDVTVQAQILELLNDLQRERGLSVLLITHDLGVVRGCADEVYVLYAGRVVERGPADTVLRSPAHPYTAGLVRCSPRLGALTRPLPIIPGYVPPLRELPGGCRFHPRCEHAASLNTTAPTIDIQTAWGTATIPERCFRDVPDLRTVGPEHCAACHEVDVTPTSATVRQHAYRQPDACAPPAGPELQSPKDRDRLQT